MNLTARRLGGCGCGHKVLLDADLASLYGVATKVLLQAVKRHSARFRVDFMLRLSAD